jgi:hypothetical protein
VLFQGDTGSLLLTAGIQGSLTGDPGSLSHTADTGLSRIVGYSLPLSQGKKALSHQGEQTLT